MADNFFRVAAVFTGLYLADSALGSGIDNDGSFLHVQENSGISACTLSDMDYLCRLSELFDIFDELTVQTENLSKN